MLFIDWDEIKMLVIGGIIGFGVLIATVTCISLIIKYIFF